MFDYVYNCTRCKDKKYIPTSARVSENGEIIEVYEECACVIQKEIKIKNGNDFEKVKKHELNRLEDYIDQSIKSIVKWLCRLEDRIDKLEHNNKEQEECSHLMDGDTCILCEYTPKNCKDKENE